MKRIKFIYKRYLFITTMLVVMMGTISGLQEKVHAQGITNINVTGIPGVINTPFTDEFIDNFRNGRYQVIFTYNNSNQQPVDFRFRFGVYQDGKLLLEVESSPQSYKPGAYVFTAVFAELPFPDKLEDILNSLSSKLQNQIVQGGTVPEGRYMLKVEAIAEPGNGMISSMPSITNFMVIYPEAPILINPQDKTIVSQEVPVFNWTAVPISGYIVDYDFLLVEVFENQTPIQAINSNRAHAERILTSQNTLIYTPEFLPLENGKEYAWRIKAGSSTNDLPIKNDGESPIRTFTYQKGGAIADGGTIEKITLIPGFASLKELDELELRDEGNTLVMNGVATLELNELESQRLAVQVNNLVIQKGNSQNPIVLGGSLETNRDLSNLPLLGEISSIADIKKLRWRYSASAVEVNGDIILPNDEKIPTNSWVRLTPSGLNGSLIADNVDGVIRVGDDPLELYIERFEASFPGRQLFANGRIELFNGASVCELSQLNVFESESRAIINCPDDAAVQLVEGSAQLELLLDNINGAIDYDFIDNTVSYDLAANGEVTFGLEELTSCSAMMQVNLNNETGFSIAQINPTCSIYAPPLDLGFMKLKLSDIDLNSLAYTGDGSWDFDIVLNAALRMPALSNWTLPLSNVQLGPGGLKFPKLEWNSHELGIRNPLDIEGFGIKPISFNMPEFTFPWFNWDSDDVESERTGDWIFNFDFDFTMPNFARLGGEDGGFILPPCFVAQNISGVTGSFNKGSFNADVPATLLKNCSFELAEGYTFTINELSGELTAETSVTDFNLESALSINADLTAGYPFTCGGDQSRQIASTDLKLDNRGLLTGNVDGIVDICEAEIGPLKVGNLTSNLIFRDTGNTQHITIDADGELTIGGSQKINGELSYNLVTGAFDKLNFDYDNLFLLNLPSEDESVLTFLTNGFSLTEAGILIDGRQRFILGDRDQIISTFEGQVGLVGGSGGRTTITDIDDIIWPDDIQSIGVTFDNTLISLTDFGIISGQVIFDETFALQAGISEGTSEINFSVTQKRDVTDDMLPEIAPNSLYAELGTQVIIDNQGLHTDGTAMAALKLGDFEVGDLSVDFNDDFYMSLNPFKVNSGEADINVEDRRIAYFNSSGFHLDPTYLVQAIPDTLFLPTEETAYLVLRDQNGDLLVDAQRQQNGNYIMTTNSPVDLVVPIIKGGLSKAPQVAVSFSDVTYNPESRDIIAGSIQGDFTPGIDLSEIGIPFVVERIRYDDGWSVNDEAYGSERGLFLEGEIQLFEQPLGDAGRIALYLENGERLRGELELKNLEIDVPLVEGSNLAVLGVDTLGISVDVSLISLEKPEVNFDLDGQIRFQNQDDEQMAALGYRANYKNSVFTFSSIKQPEDEVATHPYFAGPIGFSIDKIISLNLGYSSETNRFSFGSELDFSVWLSFEAGDTLKVPLSGVEIKETGITIPQQYANESSTPALRADPVVLGPTKLTPLSFETLNPISFNWFTGEAIGTSFKMDFDLKLAAFEENSPAASSASITLKNVGYNKGVLTGEIEDYTFRSPGAPIAFGSTTNFYLTKVGGGLINDGTESDPAQGFDIRLTGNLQNEDLFAIMDDSCINPELELQLSSEGGLIGSVTDIAPCGLLAYGPAKISFNQDSKIDFAFNSQTQSIILDGGVEAVIEQPNRPNDITATGDIKIDVIAGNLIDGEILVTNPFDYGYPVNDPLFNFRIQQARLNQSGLVISGDADLGFPETSKTVGVEFVNFTIHPKQNHAVSGEFTVEEAFSFEVGVSPVNWKIVDPESVFDADNTARITMAAGLSVNKDGLQLAGEGTAEIRALEEFYGALQVDYSGFELGFSPVAVQSGRADFKVSGSPSPLGYLDKDGFNLDLPGLIASVIPDTLPLPSMETAYLVLGDDDGSRWEMDETGGGRSIKTLPDKTVELVIPKATNASGEVLKAQVEFSVIVDQFMSITDGEVTLKQELNLNEFLGIPLIVDTLNYTSQNQKLMAGARVLLPSSLNDVVLATTLEIGNNGFEQASISAGEFAEFFTAEQETLEPLAHTDLGDGAFEIFVRGFKAEIGVTNSLKFSGQLKSSILKNTQGEATPIHYAAVYENTGWQVHIDDGNLNSDGINLGYAQIKPYENAGSMFTVTMDANEFAIAFSGTVSMPELLGEEFKIDVDKFKISSLPNYVTISASADLPPQEFTLINEILNFTSTQTSVAFTNNILTLTTSGSFDFYDKTGLEFSDLSFNSNGEISLGGADVNLLTESIALLPEDILVLEELRLGIENNTLYMAATGSSKLPAPLEATAQIAIKAGIDGELVVTGPEFIFDSKKKLDDTPNTEFALGDFATLELLGMGLNINLKEPARTALYAGGVIYVNNEEDKLIEFGDIASLSTSPGIKYSLDGGVEWNVESNFAPDELKFDYDFFKIEVLAVAIKKDVSIGGETVPFQITIGGKSGLNIAGVEGSVDFSGFKFSTLGVDDVGNFDGGAFDLMGIVSLELGSFNYQTAAGDPPLTLKFEKGSGEASKNVKTETVTVPDISKYLHFKSTSGGQALKLSLGSAFSGGVEEVLAYKTTNGNSYLRIKNANLSFTDQVEITAGMEYINEDGGFALRVSGGAEFAGQGAKVAGMISTLNDELRFGIFATVQGSFTFAGIVTLNEVGGGFYYKPTSDDFDIVLGLLGENFHLNGQQPDVENLKFAAFLYASMSIGGTGSYAGITANALLQVTDQFTKIDANGYALGQKNSFKASMYLTVLYTPNISGIEGGISLEIDYTPILLGVSKVDFFATKETGRSMLWGVTGKFKLEVLPDLNMLLVKGDIIVSNDGLFLDLAASSGFDIAVISANSSFNLIVWYLPDYSDPLGIYGEFSISFSVLAGAAKFRATVEGGYFDRTSYSVLYFGGSAYVEVFWVFSGTMKGWVKFQTKRKYFDYGRGSNAEMDELIGAAREYANKAKEKAEETKAALNDAKDRLNNALAAGDIKGFSDEDLREAGFKLVSGEINYYQRLKSILQAERNLSEVPLPDGLEWLVEIMNGKSSNYEAPWYSGWTQEDNRSRPKIDEDNTDVTAALDELYSALPAVEERLDEAIAALSALSNQLSQSLDNEEVFNIQKPLNGISYGVSDQNGNLISPPSFNIDTLSVESNKDKLAEFEGSIYEADSYYINALKLAATSISLVDLVVDGKTYIDWDTILNEGEQNSEASSSTSNTTSSTTMTGMTVTNYSEYASISQDFNVAAVVTASNVLSNMNYLLFSSNTLDYSINEASQLYTTALAEVRKYNSMYLGSYWDLASWAGKNKDILSRGGIVIDYAARQRDKLQLYLMSLEDNQNSDWFETEGYDFDAVVALAKRREDIVVSMGAEAPENPVDKILKNQVENRDYSTHQRYEKLFNNITQLWQDLPEFGFDELEASAKHVADSLSPHIQSTIKSIGTDYRAYTEKVEELYGIKSEMLVTMHGMIENYNLWQTEVFGSVESVEGGDYYTNNIQDIEKLLSTPTIGLLAAKPLKGKNTLRSSSNKYRDFYGIAELTYFASHPNDITEVSFALEGDDPMSLSGIIGEPITSIYKIRDYYTAGPGIVASFDSFTLGAGQFEFYVPKFKDSKNSVELTGAIRVRGGGGNTAAKLVNISIPVGKSDNEVSFKSNTVMYGSDTTPPTTPVVIHEYRSKPLVAESATASRFSKEPGVSITRLSPVLWASNLPTMQQLTMLARPYYNGPVPKRGLTRNVAFTTPTVSVSSTKTPARKVKKVQTVQTGQVSQSGYTGYSVAQAQLAQSSQATISATSSPQIVVSDYSGIGSVVTSPSTDASLSEMQAAVSTPVLGIQEYINIPATVFTANRTKYWVPDSTKISFTISSADNETGISKYEYRIGTTPNSGDIKDWSEAQGSRTLQNEGLVFGAGTGGAWFSIDYAEGSETMQTTIRGVRFRTGQDYYFSFRTENGDGLKSEIKTISTPFRFDATPPTVPKVELSPPTEEIEIQSAPENPVVQYKTRTTPRWASPQVNYDDYYTAAINQTSSWSSTDHESGLAGYFVAISSNDNEADSVIFSDDRATFRPITEEAEEQFFSYYKRDQYLYVKALNNAGLESGTEMITLRTIDRTPPTTPLVKIKEEVGGFTIYITRLSQDRHTGLAGYQYAILSESGADTLRNWPRSQQVDLSNPTKVYGSYGSEPPSLFVDAINNAQVSIGGKYRVAVRAINEQGLPSRVALTKDVIIDNTPPTKLIARVKYDKENLLKVDFTQLSEDPESGIQSVKYKIVPGKGKRTMSANTANSVLKSIRSARSKSNNETSKGSTACDSSNPLMSTEYNSDLKGNFSDPSLDKSSYISLNKILSAYAGLHPCISDFEVGLKRTPLQQMAQEGLLPELVVTVRNGSGLETTSKFRIEIPPNLEGVYLKTLEKYLGQK